MVARRKNTSFSVIQILIFIFIVFAVGLAGYLVYRHHQNELNHPYTNWQTSTLKYERLSFKYPKNWTLKNLSGPIKDKTDYLSITAPDGFQIQIISSNDGRPSGDGSEPVVYAEPVSFLGQKAFIDYYNVYSGDPASYNAKTYKPTLISGGWLAKTSSNFLNNLFTTRHLNPPGWLLVEIYDKPGNNVDTAKTVQSDSDFKTAKLVVQSMHY